MPGALSPVFENDPRATGSLMGGIRAATSAAMRESPCGPRSEHPTDHPNRRKDRGRDEVVLNIGQPIDTVAHVNHKRKQEDGSDQPAELGHALKRTPTRSALQGYEPTCLAARLRERPSRLARRL